MQVTKSPPAGLPSGSASASPTGTPSPSPSASGPRTTVVWYTFGSQPNQLPVETEFVNKYNATNTDHIYLQLSFPHEEGPNPPPFQSKIEAGEIDIFGPVDGQTLALRERLARPQR